MTIGQQKDDVSAAGGQALTTAMLEVLQPQEVLDAMRKIAEATEKSVEAPRRDVVPYDAVWGCAALRHTNRGR